MTARGKKALWAEMNNVSKEVPTIALSNDELLSDPKKGIFYHS